MIKDFAGHGIGKNLHSPPFILHYENTVNSRVMEPGMTFTIGKKLNFNKKNLANKI